MAAIFAYHHCRCSLCRGTDKEYNYLKDEEGGFEPAYSEDEFKNMSPGEQMEARWWESTCSAEWWIYEEEN